jgi:hypothetical protein
VANYATAADVSALRPLTSDEQAKAGLLLEYASVLIRQNVPDVDARLSSGALDAAVPRLVSVSMVLRALGGLAATPGAKSESQTVGPYSKSVTYAEAVGSGLLTLTAADLAMLAAAPTTSAVSAGVGTIRLGSGYDRYGGGW